MDAQKAIGARATGTGQLILFAVFLFSMFDLAGLHARGGLLLPLAGYLAPIFVGVGLQFVGAAIQNMKFTNQKLSKPTK